MALSIDTVSSSPANPFENRLEFYESKGSYKVWGKQLPGTQPIVSELLEKVNLSYARFRKPSDRSERLILVALLLVFPVLILYLFIRSRRNRIRQRRWGKELNEICAEFNSQLKPFYTIRKKDGNFFEGKDDPHRIVLLAMSTLPRF